MSEPTNEPDIERLPEPPQNSVPARDEGESEIPWKAPVAAAILGALVVAVYVIYAIVTGPGVESDEGLSETTVPASQPSQGFPPGYVHVAGGVGARVESVTSIPAATVVAVTTAVARSIDPQGVAPLDVAYWELETSAGSSTMQGQYRRAGLVGDDGGYITVQFDPGAPSAAGELVAYPVKSVVGESRTIELSGDLPAELTDYRIDLGGGPVVVVDSLTIDNGGGFVRWRVEGGMTARLDVVVHFVGTSDSGIDDTLFVPEYGGPSFLDLDTSGASHQLPYAFGSQYRLVPSDRSLDAANPPTAILVEFRVQMVTEVAEPVSLPIAE